MAKVYKYFKRPFSSSSHRDNLDLRNIHNGGNIYRYSNYMQSKDADWINRNTMNHHADDFEPIEEDIRD